MSDLADIFISYSKKDLIWLNRLKEHISHAVNEKKLGCFDDSKITPGSKWESDLLGSLNSASIIIILVSQHLLGSKYILEEELPVALERAERAKKDKKEKCLLLQIRVRHCDLPEKHEINKFQAVHDIKRPLTKKESDTNYHDEVFASVSKIIRNHFQEPKQKPKQKQKKEVEKKVEKKNTLEEEKTSCLQDRDIAYIMSMNMNSIRVLEMWVDNTFEEWKAVDDRINSYDVRIKTTKSLIKKSNTMAEKNSQPFSTEKELFDCVDDIVGVRVLVYSPSQMMPMHLDIIKHARFHVKEITIHYSEGMSSPVIGTIKKIAESHKGDIKLNVKNNESGYTGVHYVICPNPSDSIYTYKSSVIFHKFELQVRTVVQHAWSELEHREIYKGVGSEKKSGKFEMLANVINHADQLLDKLIQPANFTKTKISKIPASDNPVVNKAVELVSILDSNDENRYEKTQEFETTYSDEISEIIKSGEYFEKLNIAELFLKGGFYKKSNKIYSELIGEKYQGVDFYEWAILRYVEGCDAVARNDDSEKWIQSLGDLIVKRDVADESDQKLFLGASFYAWKNGNIDLAIALGNSLYLALDGTDKSMQLKILHNQLYFLLEKSLLEKSIPSELLESLLELKEIERKIQDITEDNNDFELAANQKDTQGWFYYHLGMAYEHTNKDLSKGFIEKSHDIFVELLEGWDGSGPAGVGSLWLYHKSEVEIKLNSIRE